MSKVHVLTQEGGMTRVLYHVTTPAGSNSAGVTWVDAVKNSGVYGLLSKMPTGNTPGAITTAEANQLAAGSVIEFEGEYPVPDNITTAQANQLADENHAAKVTEVTPQIQTKLKFFGFTRA